VQFLPSRLMQKFCAKCKITKDVSEFHRRKNIYQGWCKSCRKEIDKYYHNKNRQKRISQTAARREACRKWFYELKYCSENHIACLDFHHINKKEKVTEVSNALRRGWAIDRIKTEIDKCEIVCSNCHRKLHWEEKYGQ
jgi:hypothetical protein